MMVLDSKGKKKMENFNFVTKRQEMVQVLGTVLNSAQSDHLIDTKHIAVNLTLEKCLSEP